MSALSRINTYFILSDKSPEWWDKLSREEQKEYKNSHKTKLKVKTKNDIKPKTTKVGKNVDYNKLKPEIKEKINESLAPGSKERKNTAKKAKTMLQNLSSNKKREIFKGALQIAGDSAIRGAALGTFMGSVRNIISAEADFDSAVMSIAGSAALGAIVIPTMTLIAAGALTVAGKFAKAKRNATTASNETEVDRFFADVVDYIENGDIDIEDIKSYLRFNK